MAAAESQVGPEEFRHLMGRWATGVSVVTAHENGRDVGLTVNALLSVSLHPPTLLVSLMTEADSTPVIERTGKFGVSVLAADQRSMSERFAEAIPAERKFVGLSVLRGSTGVALLPGAAGHLECEVERMIPAADHHLIVGRVVALASGPDGLPLLFYRGRYGESATADSLRLPPGRP